MQTLLAFLQRHCLILDCTLGIPFFAKGVTTFHKTQDTPRRGFKIKHVSLIAQKRLIKSKDTFVHDNSYCYCIYTNIRNNNETKLKIFALNCAAT